MTFDESPADKFRRKARGAAENYQRALEQAREMMSGAPRRPIETDPELVEQAIVDQWFERVTRDL